MRYVYNDIRKRNVATSCESDNSVTDKTKFIVANGFTAGDNVVGNIICQVIRPWSTDVTVPPPVSTFPTPKMADGGGQKSLCTQTRCV